MNKNTNSEDSGETIVVTERQNRLSVFINDQGGVTIYETGHPEEDAFVDVTKAVLPSLIAALQKLEKELRA